MYVTENHINQFLVKCRNANWAGVFFSVPHQADFQFFLQNLNLIQADSQNKFIFHPFNQKMTPRVILNPHFINDEAIKQLENNIDASGFWELPVLNEIQNTTKEIYSHQFEKYISAIHAGTCSKAILSTVTKQTKPAELNVGEFIFQLRKEYPQAFIYLFSSPITGTWIGATPETFLKWKENEISTMSLAGTKNKAESNFSFGDKEKTEQQIVTKYIEDIFKDNFGEIKFENPVEFSYGEMVHLITTIKATTVSDFHLFNFLELANKFHPTPAVGGYPKPEAISLINTTEKHPRLYYSGYLGPLGNQSAELAVNLRCMTLNRDSLFVFAGGGITKDSELEAEWAETRLKAQALLRFL